jgi:hypothetical protein
VSRAAAENVTGDATVAPLPGAHILTVLSVVAVQVCAAAPFANRNNEKNTGVANESERSEITQDPKAKRLSRIAALSHPRTEWITDLILRGHTAPSGCCKIGKHLADWGCPAGLVYWMRKATPLIISIATDF